MRRSLRKGALAAAIFLPVLGGGAVMAGQEQGGKDRIEGVWDVRVTNVQCDTGAATTTSRGYLMYGPGGRFTSIGINPPNSLATGTLGTWRHLRGQSYTAADIRFIFNADGSLAEIVKVTREIELSTNANEYTNTATTEVFSASDQLISTGCATATATRLFE